MYRILVTANKCYALKFDFESGNSCLSPYSDKDKELVLLYNDLKKL